MSKKILSLILCLSLLMSLFTLTVSAAGNEADNDINFSELGKLEDVTLASIEVSTLPTKVEYLEGKDALDLTGAKLKLIYSDESHEEIDLTPDMVTGFNNAEVGEQTLTVTYEGLTAEFKVAVVAKSVVSIAVTTKPTKLTYVEGDALDTTGMVVTATYDNDDTAEVTEWDVAADMDVAGTVTVTVIYDGKSTTFEVTVNHDYAPADCDTPATCKICKATTGKELGHKYDPATCTEPATCSVCKATTGKELGHKYSPATCTKPATCSVCKATTGKAKGHTYVTTTTKATLSKDGSIVKKCACGVVGSKTTIKKIKTIKLSATAYTYDGKAKKPTVSVKDSAGKTVSSKNYTVTYAKGLKNVGTYKVTVKFKGNYSGSKTLTFKINPPKTTVKSLTAGKKNLKVSITKKSSQVTGYEVQYATSKSFKSAKTKTVKSYKTTAYTIKSLSAKKTYYVRVRTFKTVSGKKYYSGWSTAKYKKTK